MGRAEQETVPSSCRWICGIANEILRVIVAQPANIDVAQASSVRDR